MANELNINLSTVTYVKDPFNENLAPGALAVSVTGKQLVHGSVDLTTTDATLNKGNVGTIGYVFFRNKVGLTDILIGSDGTLYPLKLKTGEFALVRWNAAAMHAKMASGTGTLEYWAVED